MESKETMYNKLANLMSITINGLSSEPTYIKKIQELIKEYGSYSIGELFVLAKIDMLLMDKCINEKTHSNLTTLYKTYMELEEVGTIEESKMSECILERANKIRDILDDYNLLDYGLHDLLEDLDWLTQYDDDSEKEIENKAKEFTRIRIFRNDNQK